MDERGTIKERVRSLDAESFASEVDRIWQATETLKDTVLDQVRNGALQPAEGLEVIGCVVSHSFGHAAPPVSADFLSALQPSASR